MIVKKRSTKKGIIIIMAFLGAFICSSCLLPRAADATQRTKNPWLEKYTEHTTVSYDIDKNTQNEKGQYRIFCKIRNISESMIMTGILKIMIEDSDGNNLADAIYGEAQLEDLKPGATTTAVIWAEKEIINAQSVVVKHAWQSQQVNYSMDYIPTPLPKGASFKTNGQKVFIQTTEEGFRDKYNEITKIEYEFQNVRDKKGRYRVVCLITNTSEELIMNGIITITLKNAAGSHLLGFMGGLVEIKDLKPGATVLATLWAEYAEPVFISFKW